MHSLHAHALTLHSETDRGNAAQSATQRNASNASPEHHIRACLAMRGCTRAQECVQRKKHPYRRTPPAWVGRQDDGGNTRGGLLQAGQTHFTHTPTRGNTPLFAPAPSSDHGMRKLRGSVIRAARTTGQTQQSSGLATAPPRARALLALHTEGRLQAWLARCGRSGRDLSLEPAAAAAVVEHPACSLRNERTAASSRC